MRTLRLWHRIRYEHLTYHPEWGYKKVGSTCIHHLTKKDKELSGKVLSCYRNISSFVHKSFWHKGTSKSGKPYIGTKRGYDLIRIYGTDKRYALQIALKEKGRRCHHYKNVVDIHGKTRDEAKELAYIVLRGLTASNEDEKKYA